VEDGYMRTAVITSLLCATTGVLYVFADLEPSPLAEWLSTAAPTVAIILWLERDAARTGVGSVHDLGYLLCFAWPIVVPWYALRTRGRAGWRLILLLFALACSAYLGALVAVILRHLA
jgi:hypothetical protein